MSARAERNQDQLDQLIRAADAAVTAREPRPTANSGPAHFGDSEAALASFRTLLTRFAGREYNRRGDAADFGAIVLRLADEPRFQSFVSAADCRRWVAWLRETARREWAGPGEVRPEYSRKQSRRARIGAELKRDGNPFRDAEAGRLRAAGLTLREIAARLRIGLGTVQRALARQRVRDAYASRLERMYRVPPIAIPIRLKANGPSPLGTERQIEIQPIRSMGGTRYTAPGCGAGGGPNTAPRQERERLAALTVARVRCTPAAARGAPRLSSRPEGKRVTSEG